MLFDQIQERVDIFAAREDRAGKGGIAAAFAVVDRSILFDQPAAAGRFRGPAMPGRRATKARNAGRAEVRLLRQRRR